MGCDGPEQEKQEYQQGTQAWSPGTIQSAAQGSLRNKQFSAAPYNNQPYDRQIIDYDQYGQFEPHPVDSNTALLLNAQDANTMGTFHQGQMMFGNSPQSSKTQRTGSGRNETPKLQNLLNNSMPVQNH